MNLDSTSIALAHPRAPEIDTPSSPSGYGSTLEKGVDKTVVPTDDEANIGVKTK